MIRCVLVLLAGLVQVAWSAPDRQLGSMADFIPGGDAAPPTVEFAGRLAFGRERFQYSIVHHDRFGLLRGADRTFRLPSVDLQLFSDGADLLPVEQWPIPGTQSEWELLPLPGETWRDPATDRHLATLPFALMERNANCLHYGVMQFAFDDSGLRSPVRWQISSETCAYLKFDAWGVHDAELAAATIPDKAMLAAGVRRERAARLPVKPMAAIDEDFPGIDHRRFGSEQEVPVADMTAWGFVIDGVHYASRCPTRAGDYPWCDELPLPSYSLAKTLVAGLGLMRGEQLEPGLRAAALAELVPECGADPDWEGVNLEHALDMATGNFDEAGYQADEDALLDSEFFLSSEHATKIRIACERYSRKVAPGTRWVYHTTDTYALGTALGRWHRQRAGEGADFYHGLLVEPVWAPLGLSELAGFTRRSADSWQQPFTGWGLALKRGDIALLVQFLGADRGRLDTAMPFDAAMFEAALQRDDNDRGLPAGDDRLRYNNGFWAYDAGDALGCDGALWIPFMSGYGGIIVALFPNDSAYYYVSDGDRHRWLEAARAAHQVRPMCTNANREPTA